MKRLIHISICLLLAHLTAWAGPDDPDFNAANEFFAAEDYSSATAAYLASIEKGDSGAAVFYNLGNTYYKQEMYPEAILYYEKSLKQAPADPDATHNLSMAKLKIIDRIEPVPQLFLLEWRDAILGSCSSCRWSLFSLVAAWAAFGAMVFYLFVPWKFASRISWYKVFAFGGLGLLFALFALQQRSVEHSDRSAVLFAQTAYVKSAPNNSGTDLFILHEGVKVQVVDEVGEWYEIRLADGKLGWLPQQQLRPI